MKSNNKLRSLLEMYNQMKDKKQFKSLLEAYDNKHTTHQMRTHEDCSSSASYSDIYEEKRQSNYQIIEESKSLVKRIRRHVFKQDSQAGRH